MIISNNKQLTVDTVSKTFDSGIFATRKSHVNGQMSKVKRFARGFTIVEALIAIAILLTAVVGPISLIGDATHRLYYSRDRLIALNLAQEGIEVVRQKRDSNMLGNIFWNNELSIGSGEYILPADIIVSSPVPCVPSCPDKKIYLDNTTSLYKQSSTNAVVTPFSRTINTTMITANEMKVTSTVTWTTGGQAGTVTVSEYLYKWAVL